MGYQVVIPKPVQKQLDRLQDVTRNRILEKLAGLQRAPRPDGCVKLTGYEDEYRIRVGDYRVRYMVDDQKHAVVLHG